MSDDHAPGVHSLKATLLGGVLAPGAKQPLPSISATLQGSAEAPALREIDWGGTLDATIAVDASAPALPTLAEVGAAGTQAGRSTVLPRRNKHEQSPELEAGARPRFDRVRLLGKGAMGEVELARDNDIRRTVAVKRLHSDATSEAALLRFADEIRVVGQLEHPGIVPIYDVGRDDAGQVYLVMKHLHGETMEDVIAKLHAGDASYRARFSLEYRVHLFLGVLDAVRYAHARGILHRDIKPANIQIGPFGEVTVMDWGIAKPIERKNQITGAEPLDRTLVESHDRRLLQTQLGSLAGTPLYMSPEQAAGRNAELDERSDVYALSVLFYEWLVLEHPLQGKNTITEVLAAIISEDYTKRALFEPAHSAGVPMEYVWIAVRGLERDRERRFQSVTELEDAIKRVLDGHISVQCHVTFGKRAASNFTHWIDRHPLAYTALFAATTVAAVAGLAYGLWRLAHAVH